MIVFQKTCYCCFQYLPIIFVFAIILYEYVIFLCFFLINWFNSNPGLTIFVALEFHFFLILLIISYLRTCFSSPGFLPENLNDFFPNMPEIRERTIELKKKLENEKRMEYEKRRNMSSEPGLVSKEKMDSYQAINVGREPSDIPQLHVDELTEVTYCFKCEKIKIPRAHHCRTCNKCVLRMDHHCPWTGNCVGLNNHKFFVLFLLYACVCLLNIFACMSSYVYHLLFGKTTEDFSTIINDLLCEIIAITFFISIFFLLGYNVYSICKNITTIESNYDRIVNDNPFSKGSIRKNVEEVFGEDVCFWLLPTKPKFKDNQNFDPSSISIYNSN